MSTFADWGGTASAESMDAAEPFARDTLASVAREKGWTDAWKAVVSDMITKEAAASRGWFSDDVAGFYSRLAAGMAATAQPWPTNWGKLANAYSSGTVAAEETATNRAAGNVAAVVEGTAAGTAADIAKDADPTRSAWPWLLALGLLGIGLVVRGRK